MSENWEGFSPEEILRINHHKSLLKQGSNPSSSPVKKINFKQNRYSKKNMTRERMLKISTSNANEEQLNNMMPQEARLCVPQQITEEVELEDATDKVQSSSIPDRAINKTQLSPLGTEVSLEEFEKNQKMIKEQNRQKEELLKKALKDRTKSTHEEAQRLGQIEEELKKLDMQLGNDVSILRNQIEVASLAFTEAQKRFDRSEREYLDAKLALFTKQERKDLLTSHLCTIIEQNELRKAKKLSDLMDKLQLGSVIIEKQMEISKSIATEPPKQESEKTEMESSQGTT